MNSESKLRSKLKEHLKKFTVKELKAEVLKVKKGFQVSKLKRDEVINIIIENPWHFFHLVAKKKNVKSKRKPTV